MRTDLAEAYQGAHARREVGTDQRASFALRPATMDDAALLFDWRNDPDVRKASFRMDVVEWEPHVAWLASKVGSIRIALSGATPVGQVRIDGDVVSFSVAKEVRGQGIGTRIIRAAMTQPLVALVKPDNLASCGVFERLGWLKRVKPEHVVYTFE